MIKIIFSTTLPKYLILIFRFIFTSVKQFLNFSPGNSAGGPGSNPKSSPSIRRTQSSMQLLGVTQGDLEALIRTLRRLLAAVTRILLLADNVVGRKKC